MMQIFLQRASVRRKRYSTTSVVRTALRLTSHFASSLLLVPDLRRRRLRPQHCSGIRQKRENRLLFTPQGSSCTRSKLICVFCHVRYDGNTPGHAKVAKVRMVSLGTKPMLNLGVSTAGTRVRAGSDHR